MVAVEIFQLLVETKIKCGLESIVRGTRYSLNSGVELRKINKHCCSEVQGYDCCKQITGYKVLWVLWVLVLLKSVWICSYVHPRRAIITHPVLGKVLTATRLLVYTSPYSCEYQFGFKQDKSTTRFCVTSDDL